MIEMEQKHTIRPATIADGETVFNFISRLEEKAFDWEHFKLKFKENISKSNVIYLVAVNEKDEAIAFISGHGSTVLHHEGEVWEIQEMYVSRGFRNKGIGKSLLKILEEQLIKSGCESLEVTTDVNRSDAKRFYGRSGFRNTHLKYVKEM